MLGSGHGALVERGQLERADRAVPDQRRGIVDRGIDALDRARADVEDHAIGRDRIEAVSEGRRVGFKVERHGGIDRQDDRAIGGFRLLQNATRGRGQILLAQRLADADALRVQEGVGHAATDHQRLHLGHEVFQKVDLGRDLGAADDRDHRTLRRFQRLVERVDFRLHGAAGIGRQLVADAFGRSVRAMRRRERVIDPQVAELGEFLDKRRIVLFLALVEAGVFQAQHVAVLHRRDRRRRDLADAILGESDRTLDHARQRRRDRLQRVLRIGSLRPAEMGQQDDLAALVRNLGDGRHDAFKAGVVGDDALVHGNVKVDAQQHALALQVGVIKGAEGLGHRIAQLTRGKAWGSAGRRCRDGNGLTITTRRHDQRGASQQ